MLTTKLLVLRAVVYMAIMISFLVLGIVISPFFGGLFILTLFFRRPVFWLAERIGRRKMRELSIDEVLRYKRGKRATPWADLTYIKMKHDKMTIAFGTSFFFQRRGSPKFDPSRFQEIKDYLSGKIGERLIVEKIRKNE